MESNAWIVETPGGEFVKTSQSRPKPAAGQVLVRIAASGINPLDAKIRAGQAGHARQPLPAVLGLNMSGTVVEVGPGPALFKVGDEVYGMVGGVGGHQGTLAEFISADVELLALMPKNLTMRQAAGLPLNVITAWEGLVDRAKIHAGQKVLIHGGGGGVGHIAIQIASAFGAKVYSTVSSDKKSIAEQFGATPIDYKSVSAEDYVATHTSGEGFDIVYDTAGGPTLDASFNSVRHYTGHVVSCLGWGTHALAPLSFRSATYSGVFTLSPLLSRMGRAHHGKILRSATQLAEAGKLVPIISDDVFTSSDITKAFDALSNGKPGMIVVDI